MAVVLALALVGVLIATHPRAAPSPYIDLNAEDCPPPGANELLVITVAKQGTDFVAACTIVRGKAALPAI